MITLDVLGLLGLSVPASSYLVPLQTTQSLLVGKMDYYLQLQRVVFLADL